MKELSLHIYDLLENSISADATSIALTVRDSLRDDVYDFRITDNGRGMSKEFLAKATDPWTTTRTTRKVGIGLPLIKMNAESWGGGFEISSTAGVGTDLHFWFRHSHIDRQPMGDIASTIVMLCAQYQNIRFIYKHRTDEGEYVFDTEEIKDALGGMSMQEVSIMRYLEEMIRENLREINSNE